MTRRKKIEYLEKKGASRQDVNGNVWHTYNIVLASWAHDNKMHVQGMVGVSGYSAFIWIDESWSAQSYLFPEPPTKAVRDSIYLTLATTINHVVAAMDISSFDHEKLANDLCRKRTRKRAVLTLVKVAHMLRIIDERWHKRFNEVVNSLHLN